MTLRRRLAAFLCIALTALAARAGERAALVVHTTDGHTYRFLLDQQQPSLRAQRGTLTLFFTPPPGEEAASLVLDRDAVRDFAFEDMGSDAVDAPTAEVRQQAVTFDLTAPARVRIRGLHEGDAVRVHSTDGRTMLAPVRSGRDGTVSLDLSRLPRGMYVVSARDCCTFKLVKP